MPTAPCRIPMVACRMRMAPCRIPMTSYKYNQNDSVLTGTLGTGVKRIRDQTAMVPNYTIECLITIPTIVKHCLHTVLAFLDSVRGHFAPRFRVNTNILSSKGTKWRGSKHSRVPLIKVRNTEMTLFCRDGESNNYGSIRSRAEAELYFSPGSS